MKEKKMPWWKILLIIVFLPVAIVYYVIKFYKSHKITVQQKVVYTFICLFIFAFANIFFRATKKTEIEKVEVTDMYMYKGNMENIDPTVIPEDVVVDSIEYTGYNSDIISIDDDGYVYAKNAGETTVVCVVTDDNEKTVKSRKFTITVDLTLKQQEEQRKKEEEEALKEEQELQQKRNTLSLDELLRIKDACKDVVDQVLKAPSTAEYPGSWYDPLNGWGMQKKNNIVTVTSYVDAENSFGAKLRTTFIIQFKMNDDGSGSLTYFKFGNKVVKGTYNN